jgi:ferredoxin
MFTDVLPLLITHDEVEFLLAIGKDALSIDEIAQRRNLPLTLVKATIQGLFAKGFLKKKRDEIPRYYLRSFRGILSRFLSEGRKDWLGEYVQALATYRMDQHVERAKNDPYPEAKVLPISQAVIEPIAIILPYETALSILDKTRTFAVRNCEFRETYNNCDSPFRTCLALNELSDEFVERGVAESISLDEAKQILQLADERGLVHQVIYTDWQTREVRDLCSCCSCCCTYLRTYKKRGVRHHLAKSGLVAKVDMSMCSGCGRCLERCIFNARKIVNKKSIIIEENCMGCGLCTTTCPSKATHLVSQSN